jgi:putative membrane protein
VTSLEPKSANDLAGERTDLAVERTVMAANRTLMAWVRTALSLISFGFTIYKFLDAAVKTEAAVKLETARKTLLHEQGPRRLGLMLIALGTAAMIMGTIEYFATVRQLNAMSEKKHRPVDFSLFLGIVIGLLGLFLFITILTNNEVF